MFGLDKKHLLIVSKGDYRVIILWVQLSDFKSNLSDYHYFDFVFYEWRIDLTILYMLAG